MLLSRCSTLSAALTPTRENASPCRSPSEAFYRYRFAPLWYPSRVRGICEILLAVVVCAWLAYGSWDRAIAHQTEAIIMGSILGASLACHTAALAAGILLGEAWRDWPASLTWSQYQWLEMLPTLLHAALVSHYAHLIGRLLATPTWALIHFYGVFTSLSTSVLDPPHCLAVRTLTMAHQCALVAYEAMTQPGWEDPSGYTWVECFYVGFFCAFFVNAIAYRTSSVVAEATRVKDIQTLTRAVLQRDVTVALVSNFLPPVVLQAVQERGEDARGY